MYLKKVNSRLPYQLLSSQNIPGKLEEALLGTSQHDVHATGVSQKSSTRLIALEIQITLSRYYLLTLFKDCSSPQQAIFIVWKPKD